MLTGRSETNEPEARRRHLRRQIEALAALQRVDQSLRDNTQALQAGESRVAALEEAVQAHEATVAAIAQELRELDGAAARPRRPAHGRRVEDEGPPDADHAHPQRQGARARQARSRAPEGGDRRSRDGAGRRCSSRSTPPTKKLEAAQTELASLTGARDAEAEQLRDTIGRLGAAIERDRSRRTELVEGVDGELRRRYEMIFSRRGGVAVVAVRGGTCQGCHMHVPPQLFNQIQRNEQLILCPNCQRMLYWQPEGEEASE